MNPEESTASAHAASLAGRTHMRPLTEQEQSWERLVLEYYEPRTADDVKDLDALHQSLQAIQDSPEGWKFADALLNSSAELAIFHGALVMTIKLNREGSSLQPDALCDIRDLLTAKFLDLVALQAPYRVIQKLCSALVALFVVPLTQWDQSIRHLVCLVSGGAVVRYSDIDSRFPQTHEIPLAPMALAALVVFANTLGQDISKIDHSSSKSAYLAPRLSQNYDDLIAVLFQALQWLNRPLQEWSPLKDSFGSRIFECFGSWITYSQAQLPPGHPFVENLRRLFDAAIPLISSPSLINVATLFFSDTITSHRAILLPHQAQHFVSLFASDFANSFVKSLESGTVDEQVTSLTVLAFAFGQYTVDSLVVSTSEGEQFLELLHRLTAAQTIQTVEDEISNDVLDFWEEFVLAIPDETIASGQQDMLAPQRHWLRALEELCQTARLPFDGEDFEQFSFDDPFSDYRTRISSLVQDTYESIGHSVLEKLIAVALEAHDTAFLGEHVQGTAAAPGATIMDLPQQARHDLWSMLESALHNLHQLSRARDYQLREQDEDAALERLFKSSMFGLLLNTSIPMPSRLRAIAFNLIGSFSDYFGHQSQFLLDALDTLFQRLPDPKYSEVAARAIRRLCDKNRQRLTGKIDEFMAFTEQYFSTKQAEVTNKQVLGADAAIIQALPEGDKAGYLIRLVAHIERGYSMDANGDEDSSAASTAFLQLIEIAECSLIPSNVPVDLELDDSNQAFWSKSESLHFERLLLQFVDQILQQNEEDGAALAHACKFLGLSLSQPQRAPFCFNPPDIVSIITRINPSNPRADAALCLASALISSKWWKHSRASATPLLHYALAMLERVGTPEADPDIAFSAIEFLKNTVEIDFDSVIALPRDIHERIMAFTLAALRGAEVLPKREACKFWSTMIKSDTRPNEQQHQVSNLVRHVGESLTFTLMANVGGNTPKSDLDNQCDPLRKLVTTIPESKGWIELAMASPHFPTGKAEDADKRRFLLQFTNPALPRRKAVDAARGLWHACRGVPVQYG